MTPALTFGGGVNTAYDDFRTDIVGFGGGGGLTFGPSVTGSTFDPYDFSTGPAITGFNTNPPTVGFGGPPAAPVGAGFDFITSIISGIGGFSTTQLPPAGPNLTLTDTTGAVGAPTGAVVSPVTTDGGVGFLDQLKTLAGGLLNGLGAQGDTVEVTPIGAAGSSGPGDKTVIIGLGIAAAVAYFALKK